MVNLTLSAFADEYSASFDEQLAICKQLNIPAIELRFIDGKNVSTLTDEEVEVVAKKLEKAGVCVSAIGSPIGKICLGEDMDAHLRMAENVFAIANRVGTKYVRIFSFYLPKGKTREECRADVLFALERLITLADKYGVILCHENEARIYGESPDYCLDILQYFGGRLKAVFDMGNFVLDGHDPYPNAYTMLREYIAYFHIKDSLFAGAIVPPGRGEAKIKQILDDYRSTATQTTFVTLEPHLQTFDGLNALVGKSFDNPYKFENQQIAFRVAHEEFCKLLRGTND